MNTGTDTKRTFYVTMFHPDTNKHSISRVRADDADAARQQVVRDFKALGREVLIEKADQED